MCLLGGKNDFRGILVLVGGGGEGSSDNAISISRVAFRFLNVDFDIENDYINPFEVRDNSELLRNTLNEIDHKNIRCSFKNTEDPINLAFQSIEQTSLKTLTKDFIKEGFSDIVSFISKICK